MSCQRCHSWICNCPPPIIVENTELINQQAQRIAELEAEVDRLRVDAERVNWLEAQAQFGLPWIARKSVRGRGYRVHQDISGQHATARDAIDAAMLISPRSEHRHAES